MLFPYIQIERYLVTLISTISYKSDMFLLDMYAIQA